MTKPKVLMTIINPKKGKGKKGGSKEESNRYGIFSEAVYRKDRENFLKDYNVHNLA